MSGFTPRKVDPPEVLVPVSPEVREVMMRTVAAAVLGMTPQDTISAVRSGRWPRQVTRLMKRPQGRSEMWCHVDVLLSTLQSPGV